MWATWDFDWQTWGWVGFIVYFAVWETVTGFSEREQLTHHLQAVFHAAPVTWYIAAGLWLWMGPHFLWPGLERWWFTLVGRI